MNKGKILKITENTVYIGYEDGSLKEIPIESCDFEPRMGDYVEVYGDIAIKVEGSKESTPVKKSEAKKISLVSKINMLIVAVFAVISIGAYSYHKGNLLEYILVAVWAVSMIMIVLNLIFIIISSIKKNEITKKSSVTCFIISIVSCILSYCLLFGWNYYVAYKHTSQNTSKSSMSSSKSSSISSSSQESSSSSTKSSISGNIPKNLLTIDYEERTDKQKYTSSFDYDKWAHDEFPRYLKIRVSGEVLQVVKDPDDKGIAIQLVLNEINSGFGKSIVVFIPSDYLSDIIVEGDKLDLYGKTYGVKQYVVDNSVVTQPFMVAYLYERNK